jgi:hypothetical protein
MWRSLPRKFRHVYYSVNYSGPYCGLHSQKYRPKDRRGRSARHRAWYCGSQRRWVLVYAVLISSGLNLYSMFVAVIGANRCCWSTTQWFVAGSPDPRVARALRPPIVRRNSTVRISERAAPTELRAIRSRKRNQSHCAMLAPNEGDFTNDR